MAHPKSCNEISMAIIKLLKNDVMRKALIERGIRNSMKFTWSDCAKKTMDVYDKVLNF